VVAPDPIAVAKKGPFDLDHPLQLQVAPFYLADLVERPAFYWTSTKPFATFERDLDYFQGLVIRTERSDCGYIRLSWPPIGTYRRIQREKAFLLIVKAIWGTESAFVSRNTSCLVVFPHGYESIVLY